ncbi:MAG: FixH family protein [Candidatus Eremiobacteraeota bacterium]|nr:FixH family protein [Candidatus Eremiobacteraeota bacterium]
MKGLASLTTIVVFLIGCSAANQSAIDGNTVVQNGLTVGAVFNPNPPAKGIDTLTVTVKDAAGSVVKGAVVKITSSMPSMSMGGPNMIASDNGDGTYTARLSLQYATDWTFAATVNSKGKTARLSLTESVK